MRRARIIVVATVKVSMVAAYPWGGGIASVAVLILTLPAVAFVFDNRSGALFVMASLVTIVFLILTVLLSLMAIGH